MVSYFRRVGDTRADQQFLAGGSFSNWIRLVRKNGGIDSRYLIKGLYVSGATLLGAPFRAHERHRYGAIVEKTRIRPPIFILGHWRTGTTHVHRLLAQHPDLAVVTFLHTMVPDLFLTGTFFKYMLHRSLPSTRPMDNVTVGPDETEEEEYALGNLAPYSFYHALSFPRKMREIFDRCVLFEGPDNTVIDRWKAHYRGFLRKMTFSSGGRRLLLKNPANTGRIKALLELFPDAKFIHISRNPYVVYASTLNWLDKEMALTALQTVDKEFVRENALINYEKLMRKYLDDRRFIPDGNLCEVRFEDVETDPWGEARRIYTELGLDFDAEARAKTRHYLASVAGYRKNKYDLAPRDVQEVTRRWGFIIDQWNYRWPPNLGIEGDSRTGRAAPSKCGRRFSSCCADKPFHPESARTKSGPAYSVGTDRWRLDHP
jgi:hypothetical protein